MLDPTNAGGVSMLGRALYIDPHTPGSGVGSLRSEINPDPVWYGFDMLTI
jgi:hypothetical protein